MTVTVMAERRVRVAFAPMLARLCGPFFVLAGVMHFVRTNWYVSIMPPYVPRHREMVYASGVAEIVGGLGLLTRRRRAAGWWLQATLVAVFPANVHMAMHHEDYPVPGGRTTLLARLPFQAVFMAWVAAAMRRPC
jgi:uncharacterized membrane protein